MRVEILLCLVMAAGLLLGVQLLWFPGDEAPTSARRGSTAERLLAVDSGLFTVSAVHRRLEVLTGELDRLERDPYVFAKAFHTQVARSAYEALLADASRLHRTARPPDEPSPDLGFVPSPSSGRREVLEL